MGTAPATRPPGVSTALSRAPLGLAAPEVRVEVHLGPGLPAFALVGLPEAVVRESKERVRSALITSGFEFPPGRITVNLSPADLPKEGGRFDLPMAIGILAAAGEFPPAALEQVELYGELSLDGELRYTPKLLPALVEGSHSGRELILPSANALEASLALHAKLRLAGHLREVCDALKGRRAGPGAESRSLHSSFGSGGSRSAGSSGGSRDSRGSPGSGGSGSSGGSRGSAGLGAASHTAALGPWNALVYRTPPPVPAPDLAEVRGQFAGKRALEIAAAGEHGLLMIGPPGAGKTLLAQRLPGLLPPLDSLEALEVACLQSAAGQRPSLGGRRPFRSPQHTASIAALIGGSALKPGELSLAHRGVLFLDEFPEFARNALEALREPLESGVVKLTRLKRTCEFPAQFQLVAAMNPCPCGYAGDPRGRCHCTAEQVARYRHRISGPLMDRIDIHIELTAVPAEHLLGDIPVGEESSAAVAARVTAARQAQMRRQGKFNARLTLLEASTFCVLRREPRVLLGTAVSRLGLSARACHRVVRLARTCADLAAEPEIRRSDVAEAVRLRALDRLNP